MLRQTLAGTSSGASNPMILEFDTSLGDLTVEINLDYATVINIVVNWGDGSSDSYTTGGRKTHTYASAGVYEAKITGSLDAFGGFGSDFGLNRELKRCLSFGDLGLTSLRCGFYGCLNLIEVPSQIPPEVTNASEMFSRCYSFNQNIGSWDTSSITDMSSMFFSCDIFNQNIGGWDTSNVTNMSDMFNGAASFNQDIGLWKTGKVSQMFGLFTGATAFNQDLTSWCVGGFSSTPSGFDTSSGLSPSNLPVWGTCPSYVASGSITYIGEANGTTSATLPTHQAGDFILAFAFRDGSTTQPTIPSGWTSLNTRTGTSCCARIAYQFATSSGTTSGTWTNASTVIFLVYRGVDAPVGSTSSSFAGVSTTVTYTTQSNWQNLSRLVAFAGHRSVDTALGTPPGSLTLIVNPVDATDEAAAFQSTVDNFGAWSSTNVSVGGTSSGYVTFVVRLRVPITPI